MNSPLLEIRGLEKTYTRGGARVDALRSISLVIGRGEIVGLLGPNGSGKSTFVRAVSGLVLPEQGQILWKGRQASRREMARCIGLLLEGRGAANDRLSTFENARYFCALHEGVFRPDLFWELVRLLAIPDVHCPVRQYSTGLKLRVSLLVTLIHGPSLVLLDEPTIGLDTLGVDQLETIIDRSSAIGTSFVLCSHDLRFIERLCERVVCLHSGEVVFDGCRDDFARRDALYRATIKFRDGCVALTPSQWSSKVNRLGQIELELRDNRDLSEFLYSLRPHVELLEHFEVRHLDLREKYLSMLSDRSDHSRSDHA